MRSYPATPAAVAIIPPHKEALFQQDARDQIRKWAELLPAREAARIAQLLDEAEDRLSRKHDEQLNHKIDWTNFPPELKNMVYRLLLVHDQDEPIQPFVSYPGQKAREAIRKYDLGANILSLNRATRQEAQPILLGENTYEINLHFHQYLGINHKSRKTRGALVRKVVLHAHPLVSEIQNLQFLTNLKECTIVSVAARPIHVVPATIATGRDFAARARNNFQVSDHRVLDFVRLNRKTKFYYLDEVRVQAPPLGKDIVGVRCEVSWDPRARIWQFGGYQKKKYSSGDTRFKPLV